MGARHLHRIGDPGSEGATQASSNEMISRLDLSDRRSTLESSKKTAEASFEAALSENLGDVWSELHENTQIMENG